ncbi:oxidoreductase [Lottiidibacillus patelloidae]|uniref:Oxidoreductase n=1 Tax=Lottiidibacillus patelloidae TaxID=2670334 RepID=A0A263BWK5_9BACI|nr:GMC family oxidoreductase [Lottiidibacillus patelloidae]OZM58119.1 oxidoreductase [Lottiidibacillus patelloidae]
MTKKKNEVDFCIVGMGASGSVIAAELSKAGFSVTCLDAGPMREPKRDFSSDELEMEKLYWNDPRISLGNDPINLSRSNSGKGVGGSAVHYTAQLLRFHHSDFRTKSIEGVGEDWPITYDELAPFYDRMEKVLQLSGPNDFPWKPYGGPYPMPQHHDLSNNTLKFREGCENIGLQHSVSPLAILSAPHNNREPCINRGFCEEGCMPDSKTTPLNTFVPEAMKNGAEVIANAMVTQVVSTKKGHVKGVEYLDNGIEKFLAAKVVILASYAIETPRLLLNSANANYPNGIANSSGLVGKYLITNTNDQMIVKFNEEIRMYRGNPVQALTLDPYERGKKKGYARGFLMNSYGSRPVKLANMFFDNDSSCFGETLRERMLDYNYFGGFAMLGEVLAQEQNFVKLHSIDKDQYGLPVPEVHFSFHENDLKIREDAKEVLSEIGRAAGGKPLYHLKGIAHLMGGCRMGNDPTTSVVNSYGQTHDIKNLFIVGTPTYVTAPSANPTLTAYALALRTAEFIATEAKRGNLSS